MFDEFESLLEWLGLEYKELEYMLEANDRSRVAAKLKAKEEARKPKIIKYDGTQKGYMQASKAALSDRKYRTLLRAKKNKPSEYSDKNLGDLMAGYDIHTGVVAINKDKVNRAKKIYKEGYGKHFSIKPMLKHELEHHKQALVAKDLGGRQNAMRLNQKYANKIFKTKESNPKKYKTVYTNHPMERGANNTAVKGDDPKERERIVKSTIGYKRNKNKVDKVKYTDGIARARYMTTACTSKK